jgi:hypothetical protein
VERARVVGRVTHIFKRIPNLRISISIPATPVNVRSPIDPAHLSLVAAVAASRVIVTRAVRVAVVVATVAIAVVVRVAVRRAGAIVPAAVVVALQGSRLATLLNIAQLLTVYDRTACAKQRNAADDHTESCVPESWFQSC